MLRKGPRSSLHPPKIRQPRLIIDKQRHNNHDRINTRNRLRIVTRRTQPPRRHQPRQLLLQMGLTRKRLHTSIHRIHNGLLNINTHNLMPHVSELDSQRQPNLPKSNNSDLHEQTLPKH